MVLQVEPRAAVGGAAVLCALRRGFGKKKKKKEKSAR